MLFVLAVLVLFSATALANGGEKVFVKGTLGALFTSDQVNNKEFRGTFNPSIHIKAYKDCVWLTGFSYQDIDNLDAGADLQNYSAGFVIYAHDPNTWILAKKPDLYMMIEGGVAHESESGILGKGSANGGLGVLYPTPLGNLVGEVKAFYLPTGWQMSVNVGFLKGW